MERGGSSGYPPGKKNPTGPIDIEEIAPGIVVRLDPAILLKDERVCHTQDPPVNRPGPFLCIEVDGEMTTWAGLTTTDKTSVRPTHSASKPVGRLALKQEWRSGGPRRWRLADQFLADGASLWRGPKDVFAAASWQEVKLRTPNRAFVSEEGLDAVRIEIELQRHRRHRTCER
jgi:hypothetical protein